jgi:hypothetical protein
MNNVQLPTRKCQIYGFRMFRWTHTSRIKIKNPEENINNININIK